MRLMEAKENLPKLFSYEAHVDHRDPESSPFIFRGKKETSLGEKKEIKEIFVCLFLVYGNKCVLPISTQLHFHYFFSVPPAEL